MRHRDFLYQRYKAMLSYTGLVSLISALLILSPLIVGLAKIFANTPAMLAPAK
jgi:hypothetical protein